MEILKLTFSIVLLFSSFFVVFSSNPVHSVLFLIFAFFNAAIIFLLLDAEFLAMTLVIVYVGAIAVLFLFVVMMLNINEAKMKEGFLKYFPFGLILMSIFLIEILMILNTSTINARSNIGIKIDELIINGYDNTKSIGLYLYTDFFIIFQISGFILLVAMLGAIVLAHEEKINSRKQDPIYQKKLKKSDVIKLN